MRPMIVGLVSLCALAQGLRVAVPKEEVAAPRFQAEPQYRISDTPLKLYRDITTGDPTVRARALGNLLGEPESEYMMPQPPDITLRSVNLDDDAEPENLLSLNLLYGPTILCVADRKSDGWYIVGKLVYWWHWDPATAEHAFELHLPFIVFRETGGGTGLSETTAKIYRLWQGKLYETAGIETNLEAFVYGSQPPQTKTIEKRITFEDLSFSWWPALRVIGTERIDFQAEGKSKPTRNPIVRQRCDAFQWVPQSFSFEKSERAGKELCK